MTPDASGGSRPVRRERIHQAVARRLGTAILSGQIPQGSVLPGEVEHAEALGVSRTPYREALKTLVAMGLVESRPRTGTRVTARSAWRILDPAVLDWMFAGEPDPGFVGNLFELRSIVEPAAASLAATRRTNQQIAEMRAALEDMYRFTTKTEQGRAADRRFHAALLAASGNVALASLSSSIGAVVELTSRYKAAASENPRSALDEHRLVLDAIAAGNGRKASEAMRTLIQNALIDMDTAFPGARSEI